MSKTKTRGTGVESKLGADVVSKYNGVYTAKWCYFYCNKMTPEGLAAKVTAVFPKATILDEGDHWHSFVGSAKAGSAKDSYMWVKFTL